MLEKFSKQEIITGTGDLYGQNPINGNGAIKVLFLYCMEADWWNYAW